MAYVITELCVGTKDASCVEVCPVDCIQPGPGDPGFEEAEQLFINPEECIDCNACVDSCPVGAPLPADIVPDEYASSIARNADYFAAA